MQIKELFTDDDAVSPVIGVILMVAITVILAAVIASFVLGLGNDATQTNPQASFSFDYEQAHKSPNGNLGVTTVSHDGGDTISDNELYLRGSEFFVPQNDTFNDDLKSDGGAPRIDHNSTGPWNGTTSGDDSAIVSGDRAYIVANSTYEIDVVYEAQEGQSSSTLASSEGPDA
jgi:flagellin-like protein